MPDLTDAIEQAAQDPLSVTSDGQTVVSRPVGDLIQADKYVKQQDALAGTNANGGPRSAWSMTRTARFRPPGGGPAP